jgi:hypothetical protein
MGDTRVPQRVETGRTIISYVGPEEVCLVNAEGLSRVFY